MTPITFSDFESVITAIQGQISVNTVVGLLASLVGAVIGLVFMWWGVRKVAGAIMGAFRSGKLSI